MRGATEGGRVYQSVMPVLSRLSEYERREVEWLWPGRVPLGKVTLICGDPGVGKSLVTMDMAGRVSGGLGWPEEGFLAEARERKEREEDRRMGSLGEASLVAQSSDQRHPRQEPGSVLVLSGEDDPFDTIRPRVERAGGDTERVLIMRAVMEVGRGDQFGVALDTDAEAMEHALSQMERPRLVVIDPVSAYLGKVNSYSNAAVRAVLSRLGGIAARFGVAVVCVTHLNKTAGVSGAMRVMGSLAFAAAPRMVWRVARLADGRMGMVCVKSNVGSVAGPAAFSIEGGRVVWSAGPAAPPLEVEDAAVGALEEACVFLREVLSGGPRKASEVIAEARAAGISSGTLKRAKGVVGVVASHEGEGRGRPWVWGIESCS